MEQIYREFDRYDFDNDNNFQVTKKIYQYNTLNLFSNI